MALAPGPALPKLIQTIAWSFRPLAFGEDCVRRYGATFTMRLFSFDPLLVVTTPAHVKEVFTQSPDVLLPGRANRLLEPFFGSTSIFLLDGDAHLRQRRLLLPPFRGERMHAYAEVVRDITQAAIARWPLDRPFPIHPVMQSITLATILRTVYGLEEGAAMQDFSALLEELFQPPPGIFLFLPELQRDVPLSPFRRFLRLRERADRMIYDLIEKRRAARDLTERSDILSLLLCARDEDGRPLSDVELRDQLITTLAAGHETTATALAWTFDELLPLASACRRVREEASTLLSGPLDAARLSQLEYTEAAIKEALRMYPVAPIVTRYVAKPCRIAGYDLAPGMFVAPCIYLTHRRPDLYPEPGRFDPERFIGRKPDPYEWYPFGGGSRRCLGMAFAMFEAKVVLATIMARTELERASSAPATPIRRAVTVAPHNGVPVVLRKRL